MIDHQIEHQSGRKADALEGTLWQRLRMAIVLFIVSFGLSGCIHYDVGVRFDNPSHGVIVQHLQVEQRLKSFGEAAVNQSVAALDRQARRVGGRMTRSPDGELTVTIPFGTPEDLEQKFNQFFNPDADDTALSALGLPPIPTHLSLTRNNFLLAERNHLVYDVDLQALGVSSASGNLLFTPGSLVDLEFQLETPWGLRRVTALPIELEMQQIGRRIVWSFVPGAENQLDVVFWMPSPLGIGTAGIILLVLLGQFIQSQRSSRPRSQALPE